MSKIFLFSVFSFVLVLTGSSQTLTELVVPKYMGSKTSGSANNSRTPFAVCLSIDGLLPNTSYDLKAGLALVSDPATSYGAGNIWTGSSFQTANLVNVFTTSTSGSSAPFWLFFQPTGNASRFDAGQVHNLRIGYAVSGNSLPGHPDFTGTKTITALDIATTPRTSSTSDDGAFVKGSALPPAGGKYVLLFDNTAGNGDPLFSYMIRQAVPSQSTYPELPSAINDIYMQTGTSVTGDYPAVIPIGANNPDGVRRIESRNPDNTIFGFATDPDGIWPSGGNTTAALRREVVIITSTDASLVPCDSAAPQPEFWSDKTNIAVGDSVAFFDSTLHCPETWNWSFVGGIPMNSIDKNPTGIHYYYPGIYNVCLTASNSYGTQSKCRMGYIQVNVPYNSKIVITEISYNPPEHGTDSLEYIELYNNDSVSVDLENFHFSEGVQYTFPSYIAAPHSYTIVAKSAAAMLNTFGMTTLQWTSGSLSNSGELIRLKDAYNSTVDSVFYGNSAPWDSMANGKGPSLELCDPDADNEDGANWRHAIEFQAVNADGDSIWGSPGQGCSYLPVADFEADDTIINPGNYVTFTDSSSGFPASWNWTFEGGNPGEFSGETPPPILYTSLGTYDVTLQVSNSAGNNTRIRNNYIEVGTTGISSIAQSQSIIIFPNPNEGEFIVKMKSCTDCQVKIVSYLGRVLAEMMMEHESMNMDLSGYPAGVYFVLVTRKTFNKQVTSKILIR